MTKQENIAVLTIHRDNLLSCHTFEAYKQCHIDYIDFLIKTFAAEDKKERRVAEIIEQEGL